MSLLERTGERKGEGGGFGHGVLRYFSDIGDRTREVCANYFLSFFFYLFFFLFFPLLFSLHDSIGLLMYNARWRWDSVGL